MLCNRYNIGGVALVSIGFLLYNLTPAVRAQLQGMLAACWSGKQGPSDGSPVEDGGSERVRQTSGVSTPLLATGRLLERDPQAASAGPGAVGHDAAV